MVQWLANPRTQVPSLASLKVLRIRHCCELWERLCPGSALGSLGGPEQQVPTDEAEAQMLGSADLDDMKSE